MKIWDRIEGLQVVCSVYEILNTVNGKIYIGSSSNVTSRIKNHFQQTSSNLELAKDIAKYGEGCFSVRILDSFISDDPLRDRKRLVDLEASYIKQAGAHISGYNIFIGAGILEAKERRDPSALSRRTSRELREEGRVRINRSRPPIVPKQLVGPDELPAITRLVNKRGGRKNKGAKSVLCVETGQVYGSISEALVATGLKNTSSISDAINLGRLAAGYHWTWAKLEQPLAM